MSRSGRDDCIQAAIEHLSPALPQLRGLHGLADVRAGVPVLSRARHALEVDPLLDDHSPPEQLHGEREREQNVGMWLHWLGERPPARVALLRARASVPAVDELVPDDLRALGGRLLRLERWSSAADVLEQLEAFDPELLALPSAYTARALEAVHRMPLEARLRSLRLLLVEFDHGAALRTRVAMRQLGWVSPGGRLGLATPRSPRDAVTLALASQGLELLPYSNPENDARRVYAPQTVLPEFAQVSGRYALVATSACGLVRQRTGEHVVVVGFDAPSDAAAMPRPRVQRLSTPPPDVRLEGITIAGAWLAASVRQCLQREDPALVHAVIGPDPQARPPRGRRFVLRRGRRVAAPLDPFDETELGSFSDDVQARRPSGLRLQIELQGHTHPRFAGQLARRLDASLRRRSAAYEHLRGAKQLRPPAVELLAAGTLADQQRAWVEALEGPVGVPEVRVVET